MQPRTLTAKEIFALDDIEVMPVEIPEWETTLYVKALTALEREKYFESIRKIEGYGKKERTRIVHQLSSAKLVQMTACDKDGNLIFANGDLQQIAGKSARALERIVKASAKLNGLDDDEETEKNDEASTTTSASSSSTGSPDTSDARGANSDAQSEAPS